MVVRGAFELIRKRRSMSQRVGSTHDRMVPALIMQAVVYFWVIDKLLIYRLEDLMIQCSLTAWHIVHRGKSSMQLKHVSIDCYLVQSAEMRG